MAVRGKKDRHWELREGGPYDKPGESQEVFKCTDCGAVTRPRKGWNGEPDKHICRPGCSCTTTDLKLTPAGNAYKNNIARIFPTSPGART